MRRPVLACCVLLLALLAAAQAALTTELTRALADAQYVYIQSERKTGDFGKPS